MDSVKVKICGLANLDEARLAVEMGADLLGFNFYPPSPRYIDPLACARIVAGLQLQPRVITVGVFVNAQPAAIAAILDECGLDLAQLSGDEPPEVLAALGDRAFKALRPSGPEAMETALLCYPTRSTAPAWLVDAYRPGEYGGTGHTADWSLAHSLARQAPILLAGGLNPGNVTAALQQVRPWGVDVASGIESAPGRKDHRQMSAFISAVRSYDLEAA